MASKTLASLIVRIGADVTGVTAGLNTLERRVGTTKKQFSEVKDSTLKWQSALAVLAGTAGMALAAKKAFDLGAAVEETASKFNTTFGSSANEVNDFLADNARLMGLTTQAAQDLTSTMGAVAQGMGATKAQSAGMAVEASKLAGDLASFHNVAGGAATVLENMKSALVGEFEPMKKYGIVLRAADIEQRALADSGKSTAKELTQLEKATAAMALMQERAGVAVGDLARTMDSPANRARKLGATLMELRDQIAHGLLPAFGVILEELNGGVGGFDALGKAVQENGDRIAAWTRFAVASFKTVAQAIAAPIRIAFNLGEVLGKVLVAAVQAMRGNFAGAKDTLGSMVGDFVDMKDSVANVIAGFDDMREASGRAWQTMRDSDGATATAVGGLDAVTEASVRAAGAARQIVVEFGKIGPVFENLPIDAPAFRGTFLPEMPIIKETLGGLVEEHRGAFDELQRQAREYGDTFRDAVLSAAASGQLAVDDLVRIFTTGFAAIVKKADEAGDQMAKNLAAGLAGIGIGTSSGSGLVGALGGAAAGFSIGGPVGALVGSVTGLVSGLIEQGQRAREAERAMREATRGFVRSMEDIAASLRTGDDFTERLRQQVNQWLQAMEQATGANTGGRFVSGTDSDEMLRALLFWRDNMAKSREEWDAMNAVIEAFLETVNAEARKRLEDAAEAAKRLAEEQAKAAAQAAREAEEAAAAIERMAEQMREAARAAKEFQENLVVRGLRATGRGADADRMAMQLQHERELFEALGKGLDVRLLQGVQGIEAEGFELARWLEDNTAAVEQAAQAQISAIDDQIDAVTAASQAQIAALADQIELLEAAANEQVSAIEEQRRVAQAALQVAEEQLSAQSRMVDALRAVLESLADFQRSLVLSDLSPLSPVQQFQEARSQFGRLQGLAMGGDVEAAQGLPEAARTLLQLARSMFASSPDYVDEFRMVQQAVAAVEDRFKGRLSVEERMLAELQAQTDQLRAQVAQLQAQQDAIRQTAAEQIGQLRAQQDAARASADTQIAELRAQQDAIRQAAAQQIATLQAIYNAEMERLYAILLELIAQSGQLGALNRTLASIGDMLTDQDAGSRPPPIVVDLGGVASAVDNASARDAAVLAEGLAQISKRLSALEAAVRESGQEARRGMEAALV